MQESSVLRIAGQQDVTRLSPYRLCARKGRQDRSDRSDAGRTRVLCGEQASWSSEEENRER